MPHKLSNPQEVFQKKTGLKLGSVVYNVGSATIANLVGNKGKVVKIVQSNMSFGSSLKKMKSLLKYLSETDNKSVVKVYDFGFFKAKSIFSKRPVNYYYYVMEKMDKRLHLNEYHAVHDGYNSKFSMSFSIRMSPIPNKLKSKASVKTFVEHAKKLKYRHKDFHEMNVMKNKNGSIKFIDLESFYLK